MRPITAREASKLDARRRVYRRMYDHFDALPEGCRAALRESQTWVVRDMIRCAAAHCDHDHHHATGDHHGL